MGKGSGVCHPRSLRDDLYLMTIDPAIAQMYEAAAKRLRTTYTDIFLR
jgi:hypothetical protein